MERKPLPFSALYVHVPFCSPRKCPYCDFHSITGDAVQHFRYLCALQKELALHPAPTGLQTVYIGGGTPTALEDPLLLDAFLLAITAFAKSGGASPVEFTVEANPNSLTEDKLACFMRYGVDRISLGVQSFSDKSLKALGRSHSSREVERALQFIRQSGIANFSVDLISDVPESSRSEWVTDLEQAVQSGASHISCYSLTYEPGTQMELRMRKGLIEPIDDDESAQRMLLTASYLGDRGFERYEISNYARKGRYSKHNGIYWRNGTYLGLGPSAVSFDGVTRRTNSSDFEDYCDALEAGKLPVVFQESLDQDRFAGETAMLMLRRRRGIDVAEFIEVTGLNPLEYYFGVINRLETDGLLIVDASSIRVPDDRVPVLDSIAAEFLEH
mgnify:CR=1 FL=1